MSKKTEKPIKLRKPQKNNRKNWTEKKPIKPIKILKNQPVRFGFISKKPKNWTEAKKNRKKNRAKPEKPSQTEKTKQKPENRAKTEKTEPNRFEPVFALKNRTGTGRFDLVEVQFRFFF